MKARKKAVIKASSAAALLIALVIVFTSFTVYAESSTHRLTVNQVFIHDAKTSDDAFTYRLNPIEPGNPMPGGSTAKEYTFKINGTNKKDIILPNYKHHGVYSYELVQVVAKEKPGFIYDKNVYTIEVHVDAALVTNIIVLNKDNAKMAGITFTNVFNSPDGTSKPPTTVAPPDTAKPPSTVKPPSSTQPSNPSPPSGGSMWHPGGKGPKTGDDTNAQLYYILFVTGGITVLCVVIYLATDKKKTKQNVKLTHHRHSARSVAKSQNPE